MQIKTLDVHGPGSLIRLVTGHDGIKKILTCGMSFFIIEYDDGRKVNIHGFPTIYEEFTDKEKEELNDNRTDEKRDRKD